MSMNDPWGRGNNGGRGGKRGDDQGPPDLEEVWREFNQRLSSIFGRRREGGPSSPNGSGGPAMPSFDRFTGRGLILLVMLLLVVWLGSGFYMVDANERAVVLRLGKYNTVTGPGLNWRLPWPFEMEEKVDVDGLRTVTVGGEDNNARALMLTDDMNIVVVQFAVQFQINKDVLGPDQQMLGPREYKFENLITPPGDEFVRQIAEAAMREIVGKSKMDDVLYENREEIARKVKDRIQNILDTYHSGIQVSRVTMQGVQPPQQVRDAFDDVIMARQDEVRRKNEGEAYANKVIPAAKGRASRLRADAEGYRASVIAKAEGEAGRFRQVLTEFKRAPQVTRERMYISAVQDVLSKNSKVLIDNKGGSSLMYLPLDKLVQQRGRTAAPGAMPPEPAQAVSAPSPSPSSQDSFRARDLSRDRGIRGGR